jgi:hypothetical protein
MQSIGVLLKNGGQRAAYGHLLPQQGEKETSSRILASGILILK